MSVRSERGVGVFSQALFSRLISTMATSTCLKPESFTLLFTRYLQQPYADVRYYALLAVKEICQPRPSGDNQALNEDVARTIFDLLSNITPDNPSASDGILAIKSWCGLEEAASGVKARVDKVRSRKVTFHNSRNSLSQPYLSLSSFSSSSERVGKGKEEEKSLRDRG